MTDKRPVLVEYEYGLNRALAIFLLVLASGGELLFIGFALYSDRGANARGVELTSVQFRILMGVMAAVCPFGLWCLAMGVRSSFRDRRRIALTESSIIMPKPDWMGLSTDEIELELAELRGVEVAPDATGTKVIVLYHVGKVLMIPSNMLKRRDFAELAALLDEAVGKPPL